MAEIAYSQAKGSEGTVITWTGVTEADTFAPLNLDRVYTKATIQIGGTFGGATVVVNGSNDNTTYAGLSNQAGTAISVTAAAIKSVYEAPNYIQPSASGGTAQSLTVKLFLKV